MDRRQRTPERAIARAAVPGRLHLIRVELYGEGGGPRLAALLGLPPRTWINYERGVTIPGATLLEFLGLTGADPAWLLRGLGERFRPGLRPRPLPAPGIPDALGLLDAGPAADDIN